MTDYSPTDLGNSTNPKQDKHKEHRIKADYAKNE